MNKIAGLWSVGDRAALVVLARNDERAAWEIVQVAEMPTVDIGQSAPGCPVVLDASAWARGESYPFIPSRAETLRDAGLDVRPPLWRTGRAANPSESEWREAVLTVAADIPLGESRKGVHREPYATAFRLAAWGAMREATPTSPQTAVEIATAAAVEALLQKWHDCPEYAPDAGGPAAVKARSEKARGIVARILGGQRNEGDPDWAMALAVLRALGHARD